MRENIVTTSTGIQIGGAWTPPPPQPGHGMECVQAWLLPEPVEKRRRFDSIDAVTAVSLVCALVLALLALSNNLPGAK